MKAITSLLLMLLAGCTAVDPEVLRQTELQKQEQRAERIAKSGFVVGELVDRISFPRSLDGWGYIDDQAIWLEARPRRFYLVTLKYPCPELAFTQSIGLDSRIDTYLTELDEVIVERPSSRRCLIDAIYEMTRPKKKQPPEQ